MKIFSTGFFLLLGCPLFAQSIAPAVLASGGNSLSNAEIQLDWTLGQTVSQFLESPDHIITQGFAQPVLKLTSIEIPLAFQEVKVFPNPSNSQVWLVFPGDFSQRHTEITMSDLSGQVIMKRLLLSGEKEAVLDISNLSSAVYLLKLVDSQHQSMAIYKIIKIN